MYPWTMICLRHFGDLRLGNAANAEAICRSLMGTTGATAYYAQPQAPGGFGLALPNTVGNPNLDAEKAKTLTLGVVLKSPWENALANKLTASIDYYRIEISDAIGATSVDTVFDQCLN
jgi:outer membrane receptor protein involved in Fe transport